MFFHPHTEILRQVPALQYCEEEEEEEECWGLFRGLIISAPVSVSHQNLPAEERLRCIPPLVLGRSSHLVSAVVSHYSSHYESGFSMYEAKT